MNIIRIILALIFATQVACCEQFDDISVVVQPFHQGKTSHGYCEIRVQVENLSRKSAHRVTLVYPNHSWSSGNSITRLSRSITLAPGARATVALWQPPLPVTGDGSIRVEIDGSEAGRFSFPNANGHISSSRSYGVVPPATVLVSRSLDHGAAERIFQENSQFFTAAMATGAPNGGSRRGINPRAWTPEGSGPHWLELDFNPPVEADRVRIYDTGHPAMVGIDVILTGASGSNLTKITVPATTRGGPGVSIFSREVALRPLSEPIKTVRLEFGSASVHNISIDAVELVSSTGNAWATDARSSSDATAMAASASPAGTMSRICLRSELPASEWSEHWLSYSAYDGIVLSSSDMALMPAGVADAIWRHVECGGNLIMLGRGQVPDPWQSRSEAIENGQHYSVGLGHCFVLDASKASQISQTEMQPILRSVDDLARFWQGLPTDDAANTSFRVVDNISIPVRGMVFIMLGFVLVIGPANIILLSRLQRRTWLLWTIPAISFVTCLLVFAYSFLSEGITPDARIHAVTLLDQVNRRATTLGVEAFYCPLTPNQGLQFSFETEATPLVETWDRESGGGREVEWTQVQHLRRGWVTARVPAHFLVRKSENRRERLQVERENGKISVVNGLGAPVRSLWLREASGQTYSAVNISAGGKADLSLVSGLQEPEETFDLSDFLYKTTFASQVSLLTSNAAAYLQAGTYIAELEDGTFLEHGLGSRAKKSRTITASVVYGILEPQVASSPEAAQ